MEKVLTPFLSVNNGGKYSLIYNKPIGKGDFANLADGGRKTFTDLAKEWSTVNLPTSHTY